MQCWETMTTGVMQGLNWVLSLGKLIADGFALDLLWLMQVGFSIWVRIIL